MSNHKTSFEKIWFEAVLGWVGVLAFAFFTFMALNIVLANPLLFLSVVGLALLVPFGVPTLYAVIRWYLLQKRRPS
jgi:hypothetical protein